MAIMVLRICKQVEGGLPKDIQAKIMINIMLGFAVGLVLFLGNITLFRANTRNAVVLENYLYYKNTKNLK
jgi:hypothetical protein